MLNSCLWQKTGEESKIKKTHQRKPIIVNDHPRILKILEYRLLSPEINLYLIEITSRVLGGIEQGFNCFVSYYFKLLRHNFDNKNIKFKSTRARKRHEV